MMRRNPSRTLSRLAWLAGVLNLVIISPAHAEHDGVNAPHSTHEKTYSHERMTFISPWSRATAKGAKVGAGYVVISNDGEEDTLVKATSDISERIEIHDMKMVGDVMKMRELDKGLTVPAQDRVELKPGGYHLMFMSLKRPLKEGETINVKFTFAKSGEVELPFDVKSLAASSAQGAVKHQH